MPALIATARLLQRLNCLLLSCLDAELAQHCVLATIKSQSKKKSGQSKNKKPESKQLGAVVQETCVAQEALIIVDNAAWATRLRYAIPDLLKCVKTQPEFKNLQKIRYTVSMDREVSASASEWTEDISRRLGKQQAWQKIPVSSRNKELWREVLQQLHRKIHDRKNTCS